MHISAKITKWMFMDILNTQRKILEYGGIELKFAAFVHFRFSLYQNYIYRIVLWFMNLTQLSFQAGKNIGFLLISFKVRGSGVSQ